MSETWGLIVCHGTHTEHLSSGEWGRPTHLQRLWQSWPWPKCQVPGPGAGEGLDRRWLSGGVFGAGVDERVSTILNFMESAEYDRLLIATHSRGIEPAMRTVRTLEKRRKKYERRGHRPPSWMRVDALVALDPVASMGLAGIWKWTTGILPKKARWALNVDGVREMPGFVGYVLAFYALHEYRAAFEPTHLIAPRKPKLGELIPRIQKWWMPGEHRDFGGYPDGDQRPAADVGSWMHLELVSEFPEIETVPISWPWPMACPQEWDILAAAPPARRALRGDRALVRRPASA